MNRLRFCFLTTFYPPYSFGGDGIAVERLARGLVRRGFHVTVVDDTDAFGALHDGPWPDAAPRSDGVEVIALASRLGAVSPFLTHQFGRPVVHGRRLEQLLSAGRFDVVVFHNVSLIGGPGLLQFGSRSVRVYVAHEHWLVCPTHVLWRHNREACPGRQCLRCVLRQGRPPQLWRYTGYLDRLVNEVDAFVALTEFSRKKHHEFGFRAPMEVVPCVVQEPDPARKIGPGDTMPREGAGPPFLLFAGRLHAAKGLDDVIPAVAERPDVRLLIAGDGPEEPALRRMASACPRIEFLGRQDADQLATLYRRALAVVVPSRGFETFGMTIAEAFGHGTPVLARNLGSFPELVADGGGLLFDDREGLRAAVARLLQEPGLRERLSGEARRAHRARWSETAVIPRFLAVVERAARRRGRVDVADAAAAG